MLNNTDLIDFETKINQLEGIQISLFERESVLIENIAQTKKRVELHPEVVEYLEKIQEFSYEKSLGVYQNLLTELVQDVLKTQKTIKFELKTERGLPALDIWFDNNGELEEITSGAVLNILSVGLRVIAIVRTNQMPFIIIDEPDCWIKPDSHLDKLENYVSLLQQVCENLGFQIIIISHQDPKFFKNKSSLHDLYKNNQGIIEVNSHKNQTYLANLPPPSHRYIKQLVLKSVKSHTHTVINLDPYLNSITGENDLGKSVLISALQAVFHGKSDDFMIQTKQKDLTIELHMSDNSKIVYQQFLKKSPKRRWEYYVSTQIEPLLTGTPKHGAPDWIYDILPVQKINELDLHIGTQTSPVFIMHEVASTRAQILSIGRESDHLRAMIALHKENHQSNKSNLNLEEKELYRIQQQLTLLEQHLPNLKTQLKTLKENNLLLENSNVQINEHEALLARLNQLHVFQSIDIPELNGSVSLAPIASDAAKVAYLNQELKLSEQIFPTEHSKSEINLIFQDFLLTNKYNLCNHLFERATPEQLNIQQIKNVEEDKKQYTFLKFANNIASRPIATEIIPVQIKETSEEIKFHQFMNKIGMLNQIPNSLAEQTIKTINHEKSEFIKLKQILKIQLPAKNEIRSISLPFSTSEDTKLTHYVNILNDMTQNKFKLNGCDAQISKLQAAIELIFEQNQHICPLCHQNTENNTHAH